MKYVYKLIFSIFLLWPFQKADAQIFLPKFQPPMLLDELNSEAEEGMIIPFDDGNKIYFVRTYINGDAKQRKQAQDIWYSERINAAWSKPQDLFKEANDRGNNAVIGVNDDGSKVYLFNSIQSRRKLSKGIAIIEKEADGEWSEMQKVNIQGLNIGEGYYSFFVNPEETIMMISMPPNKQTLDEDLFVSLKQEDGSWGKVIHLGDTINTENYEISPYIAKDERTLYFSSNGHEGLGSADIFVSYRLDDSWQNWTRPVNMGEPVNSYAFDAYFVIANKEEVYFASNRDSQFSNLYYTQITRQLAFKGDSSGILEPQETVQKISGQFYLEGLPAENVSLEVLDETGDIVDVVETEEDGSFSYQKLDSEQNYVIRVAAKDKSEFGNGQIYYVDEEGNKTGKFALNEDGNYAEKGEIFNKQVFQGVYKYEELPVTQAQLVIVDENGFAVDTIVTDDQGNFNYEGLAEGEDFSLVPLKTESKELEEIDLYLTDESGEKMKTLTVQPELLPRKVLSLEHTEEPKPIKVNSQFTLEGLPVENVKLEIYNQKGELVDEVVTDEYGMFSYEKINPEEVYMIKVSAEDLSEYGNGSVYFVDEEGEKTGKFLKEEEGNFVEKGEAANKEKFKGTYTYQKLPVAKASLVIVDESGFPVDTVETDESGNFNYEVLDADENYTVIPVEADRKTIEEIDINLEDESGNQMENRPITRELLAKLPLKKIEQEKIEVKPDTVYSQFTLKGLPMENVKLEIYDEKGVLVDTVVTDESGMFSYVKLGSEKNYIVKIAAEDRVDFSGGRVYFVDREGAKKGRYSKDDSGTYVETFEKEEKTIIQGTYRYEDKPVKSAALGVMDENGFILDTVYTDDSGSFKYEGAFEEKNYSVVIMDEENVKEDRLELYLQDENGERINNIDIQQGMMTRKPVVSLLDKTVIYSQLTLKGLPVDNVKLEIYDEEGVLVDEVVTDEQGMFSYTKLDPDKNYVIKIAEEDILDYGISKIYFVDKEGDKTGRYEKRTDNSFVEELDGMPKDTIKGFYSYQDQSNDGIALGIFDENGFLMDTVFTQTDGSFEFAGLDSNEAFSVVVMDSEEIKREKMEILLTDKQGEKIKAEPIQHGLMVKKPMVSIVDKTIVKGQFLYQGLPVENVKLEIYDEEGVLVDEVVTDSYGTFTYRKLDLDKHYIVKIPVKDQEVFANSSVYLTDNERNKLKKLVETEEGTFEETPGKVNKIKFQGKFTQAQKAVKNSALAIIDVNGFPIDTFYTDELGLFEFFVLENSEEFSVMPFELDDPNLNELDLYLTDEAGDRIKTLKIQLPEREILQSKSSGLAKKKSETSHSGAEESKDAVYIYFKFNQYILSQNDKRILDLVVDVLDGYQEARVTLIGHTDNIGTEEVNYRFGESRARSARRYLTNKGIEVERITIASEGETKPIASNESDEGRAKNRRVEVVLN